MHIRSLTINYQQIDIPNKTQAVYWSIQTRDSMSHFTQIVLVIPCRVLTLQDYPHCMDLNLITYLALLRVEVCTDV